MSLSLTSEAIGAVAASLAQFTHLPDDAFVRKPTVLALFGVSHSTLWRRIHEGSIPAPCALGPRSSGWRVGPLRAALAAMREAA
jgi:predicted DNA-binding transcriptional regulator AlpA